MHTGLRPASTSRRIKPKGSIVFAGPRRIEGDGALVYPRVERESAWSFGAVANDDECFDVRKSLPRNVLQVREKRIARYYYARAAVIEQEFVVCRLQERVDGNRHGSDFNGAKKAGGKLRRVQQKQEDSFLKPHFQLLEGVANTVHRLKELTVSHASVPAFDCDSLTSTLGDMTVHEIGRRVEFLGKQKGRLVHGFHRLDRRGTSH